MGFLRRRVEKNWPELRAALGGALPEFVLSDRPRELAGGIPVFCYHTVEHEVLDADLAFLARNGYVTIGADGLLAHLRGERSHAERTVVLTFDDGPRQLHDVVHPLLHRYGLRAVAFVAPYFHRRAAELPDVPDRPCTWEELETISRSGLVDVQSHSHQHRYAPRWPEPAPLAGVATCFLSLPDHPPAMLEDYRCAREAIALALGTTVRHLAFPRFDSTPLAVAAAQKAGYEAIWNGLRVDRPLNGPGDDPLGIARLSGEFLRRLPGRGRISLTDAIRWRFAGALGRWSRAAGATDVTPARQRRG